MARQGYEPVSVSESVLPYKMATYLTTKVYFFISKGVLGMCSRGLTFSGAINYMWRFTAGRRVSPWLSIYSPGMLFKKTNG